MQKDTLSAEEQRLIFAGHQRLGNKWAEIAKQLNGRSDNAVKNFFYATLRRQFRRIAKRLKGRKRKCKLEGDVTLPYLRQIMTENSIPYSALDNNSVREALVCLDRYGSVPADSPSGSSGHQLS